MDPVKPEKVQITAIEDVDGTGLESHLVEKIDVVNLARGHCNRNGKVSFQIEQGMQFDGGFVFAEVSPGKYSQA